MKPFYYFLVSSKCAETLNGTLGFLEIKEDSLSHVYGMALVDINHRKDIKMLAYYKITFSNFGAKKNVLQFTNTLTMRNGKRI